MRAGAFVLLMSMCSCGTNDDPGRALEDARRLAQKGDYEGALAKHVWFHENALAINSAYYGVRLSFALGDWVELGKKYPKALDKLKSVRDEKTARLLAGHLDHDLFNDVQSINDNLGENTATVEIFKRIDVLNPDFAAQTYDLADEALVEAQEYKLTRKYLGDPTKRLATARENFEQGMQFAKASKHGDSSRRAFERIFEQRIVRIITVLRETGEQESAKNIQMEALKAFDSAEIKNAL